jgi:hypothetical protein
VGGGGDSSAAHRAQGATVEGGGRHDACRGGAGGSDGGRECMGRGGGWLPFWARHDSTISFSIYSKKFKGA